MGQLKETQLQTVPTSQLWKLSLGFSPPGFKFRTQYLPAM